MRRIIGRFLRDEGGATAIEYGLIAALIFLAITTALYAFAGSADSLYARIMQRIAEALA